MACSRGGGWEVNVTRERKVGPLASGHRSGSHLKDMISEWVEGSVGCGPRGFTPLGKRGCLDSPLTFRALKMRRKGIENGRSKARYWRQDRTKDLYMPWEPMLEDMAPKTKPWSSSIASLDNYAIDFDAHCQRRNP
ncbi:unnamed protein product [Sphenostylis stenocarpa]|uniref:Uncharacterized protein n=1 Tax=Sphenostylis stenocarpa TaxID=92480 RepID=A0AA86VGA9_9FABA|nr:unnamed protein product [Sphenostylis stenocarpa]